MTICMQAWVKTCALQCGVSSHRTPERPGGVRKLFCVSHLQERLPGGTVPCWSSRYHMDWSLLDANEALLAVLLMEGVLVLFLTLFFIRWGLCIEQSQLTSRSLQLVLWLIQAAWARTAFLFSAFCNTWHFCPLI